MFEVVADCADRPGREKDDTEFRALTPDAEFFLGEIDLVAVEAGKFGNAESGRKEELEDGAVAADAEAISFGCGQEPLDLVVFEEINLALGNAADLDFLCRKRLDIMFGEVFQERPDDDRVIGLSAFLEGDAGTSLFPVQVEAITTDFLGRDVLRLPDISPGEKSPERTAVTVDCPVRTAHLDLEMVEEFLSELFDL